MIAAGRQPLTRLTCSGTFACLPHAGVPTTSIDPCDFYTNPTPAISCVSSIGQAQ